MNLAETLQRDLDRAMARLDEVLTASGSLTTSTSIPTSSALAPVYVDEQPEPKPNRRFNLGL